MIIKGRNPVEGLAGKNPPALVEAIFELNHLKNLYRQGWLRRGVPEERCESVAEHIFSMAMLAWWVVDEYFPGLDRDRILRMTLVHELGEIYTGDITPGDHIEPQEKHRREREGLWKVVGKLPKGPEYLALWEEFEAGMSPEARFVRQIDRLEMGFQALIYEQDGYSRMEEFIASAEAGAEDPALRSILADLIRLRGDSNVA